MSIPVNYTELNWLNKKNKDISLPLFVYQNNLPYSGCYYRPEKSEILINERYYSLKKGLIVMQPDNDDDDFMINAIAHEWRHHWQENNGIKLNSVRWDLLQGTYDQKIVKYFKSSYTEMDALLWASKIYPSEITDYWEELIFHGK